MDAHAFNHLAKCLEETGKNPSLHTLISTLAEELETAHHYLVAGVLPHISKDCDVCQLVAYSRLNRCGVVERAKKIDYETL